VYYVYILASRPHGPIYVGVTNDLVRRVSEHRLKLTPGFTSRYFIFKLVYYEAFEDVNVAIAREKALKRWHRAWKDELIARQNPGWRDLYPELAGEDSS
jgi:putative endonuclease